MTKGGALPKRFERPSDSDSQEKYEEIKPSSKTILLEFPSLILKKIMHLHF